MAYPTRNRGFTLVELMMVLLVLAIILSIGAPSFNKLIQDNRLSATANDLAGALHYARAEAVRRGAAVNVVSLDNSNDGSLTQGLRVWFDTDRDGGYDAGEELRLVRLDGQGNLAINVSGGNDLDISFTPRGVVDGAANLIEITVCDDRSGDHGKELSLLSSGVLRSASAVTCN